MSGILYPIVNFISWADFKLTGTPWHQRRYGRWAFQRYAVEKTGRTWEDMERFMHDAQAHWDRAHREVIGILTDEVEP